MGISKRADDPPAELPRRRFLGAAATLAGTSLAGLDLPSEAQVAGPAPDRMPPIPADKMSDAQKKVAEELIAGPRKELVGPFIPLLRSPEFMSRLQKVGEYLRYNTKLGANISEFIILLTARQWSQQFEWNTHYPLALAAGVKAEKLAAVAEGRRPAGMSEDEEIVYDLCTELRENRSVSDVTYSRAVKRFAEQGVIDIVGLAGYYSLIGMIMNVARTPLPRGIAPPLNLYPH